MRDEVYMMKVAVLLAYHWLSARWFSVALRHQIRVDPMGDRLREVFHTFSHHDSRWKEVLSRFNSYCDRRSRSAQNLVSR